ncbi:MAG: bifunctional phosphopantothenoylcysteine decarboxylase/phosphopantothenate--cysteine ligase CoaBC [Gammaproteobacteria bacterium]|nr:MAG: bifunctional phosphopantothenoylcysteine decarboxylase/phosphopantothenate--cysteine ligase CoaBC [Gammaproteobacteria bacterium]
MSYLSGKNILLGITGSIAAYKSAELVRHLREAGASVRVVMTAGAAEFITPLTLQALSGHPVSSDLLDPAAEAAMGHIELARWADAVLVAPATANFIARRVHGRGDDLLTAVCLACEAPQAVAPAMNQSMWEDPATTHNVATLQERGIRVIGPAVGSQACGDSGPGRLLEPEVLVRHLENLFTTGILAGCRVLVTAGPTREPLDPVRYLGNRSSGKMGFAVAAAAVEAGAEVTLIAGPVALSTPQRVKRIDVVTAREMQVAVLDGVKGTDIFIAAAAVADYRPRDVSGCKLKKSAGKLTLELERNPDILAMVAGREKAPFTVGFAAETESVELNAQQKLQAKSIDMIAANQVGENLGFEADDNALQVFWDGGSVQLERARKTRLARQLVELVAERYHHKHDNDTVIKLHAKDPA